MPFQNWCKQNPTFFYCYCIICHIKSDLVIPLELLLLSSRYLYFVQDFCIYAGDNVNAYTKRKVKWNQKEHMYVLVELLGINQIPSLFVL